MTDDDGALFDRIEARLDQLEGVVRSEVVTPLTSAVDKVRDRLDVIEARVGEIADRLTRG